VTKIVEYSEQNAKNAQFTCGQSHVNTHVTVIQLSCNKDNYLKF